MSTLIQIERPIFLHFLDREAATSIGERRSEAEDISVIDILTICHVSGFSINLHPLAIYSANKPELVKYALQLNQYAILINTSSRLRYRKFHCE